MKEEQKSSTTLTVIRNSAVMIAAQAIVRALMVLFATFVTRRLGSDNYGRYSLVTSIVNLFSFPADLGLSLYCIRQIARERQKGGYFISNAASIRLIAALPIAIAAPLVAAWMDYERAVVIGVAVASGGFFLLALRGVLDAMLVGYERLDYSAVLSVTEQVLFMGASVLILGWRGHFLGIIGASFLSVTVAAMLSFGIVHFRLNKFRLDLVPSEWMNLIRAALPIGLLQLFFSIALRADTFILKHWQGEASVGWYSAAYDIVFGTFIIAHGINTSVFATVSRIANVQPAKARALGQSAAKYLLLFSLPCAVGGILLGGRLIKLLYGAHFAPAGPLLGLLLCALPIRFLVGLAHNLSIAHDKVWPATMITAGDALLNVTLNLLLIPRFGAQAAAGVTILCEGIALGLLLWLLRDQALLAELRRFGPGSMMALGAMAAMIYLFRHWHVLILIGAGALTYAAVLLLCRVVNAVEIWKTAKRVLGPGDK